MFSVNFINLLMEYKDSDRNILNFILKNTIFQLVKSILHNILELENNKNINV